MIYGKNGAKKKALPVMQSLFSTLLLHGMKA
jgi:hypothetical protein